MMFKLLLILLSVIQVSVVDAITMSPIPNSEIMIVSVVNGDTTYSSMTSETGVFQLPRDSRFSYTATAEGYTDVPIMFLEGKDEVSIGLFPTHFDLESITVSAFRKSDVTPTPTNTLSKLDVEPGYFGQEVPAVLSTLPNISSYSDSGSDMGYTYMTIRGVDQTRINMSVDGIPLNEPEDQGVYFSNFPDFFNSVSTVDVQNGVGTTMFGTPSYIGSVNFESVNLTDPDSENFEIQFSSGSYDSNRLSIELNTGLLPMNVGTYARISTHSTDGYRDHSGSSSESYFSKIGYYGDKNQLTLTAFGGVVENDMAYLATSIEDLELNPKLNYLTKEETDKFSQNVISLGYSHDFSNGLVWTSKVYRNDLEGKYGVMIDGLWTFRLESDWTGFLSYGQFTYGNLTVNSGIHVSEYNREHSMSTSMFVNRLSNSLQRNSIIANAPLIDLTAPKYTNTGFRGERSMFVRSTYSVGKLNLLMDTQIRNTDFRYQEDKLDGVSIPELEWTFTNPRVGLTYKHSNNLQVYGFFGKNTREPTRTDLFAGFDNVGPAEMEFIGDIHRVQPETVYDWESGIKFRNVNNLTGSVNLYWMTFRNEITPIGQLSYIGLPLRKNVDKSTRRGIETVLNYNNMFGGNLSLTRNSIEEYTDDVTGTTYVNVSPLGTPEVSGTVWGSLNVNPVTFTADINFQSETYLDNTENSDFVTPAYSYTNVNMSVPVRNATVTLHLRNLFNNTVYSSGYTDGVTSYYYPMATRNFMITTRLMFF